MTRLMTVEGMMCDMCQAHVADALRRVPGVEKVTVNRRKRLARIQCGESVTDEALLRAVNGTGYTASDVRPAEEPEKRGLFRR